MPELSFLAERVIPALNNGLWMSILLILPSALLGFGGGLALGVARVWGGPVLRRLGDGYTALFRGIPLVVQLFLVYNCLPRVGDLLDASASRLSAFLPGALAYQGDFFREFFLLDAFGASVVSFSLCSAAYHSEYVRGALLSIREGQVKAALALGFGKLALLRSVILPQAVRRALPGCGNEIIYLIKYSSLAYLVSCIELTGEAKILAGRTFRYTEIFLAVGCYYLFLTTVASVILHRLEKRLSVPGFSLASS